MRNHLNQYGKPYTALDGALYIKHLYEFYRVRISHTDAYELLSYWGFEIWTVDNADRGYLLSEN